MAKVTNEFSEIEEKEVQEIKKPEIKESKSKTPPMGYIPINLESLGKLDAPKVLHFRDFSYEEALDLADSTLEENNNLKKIVYCFNKMVWEPFDCNHLNLNELFQILYTLQSNFYDPYIEKEIYIDETLPEDELDDPTNVIRALIPISAFKTKSIPENFKEPFIIKDDKTEIEITTRLSRIKDFIDADNYWKDKNTRLIREFSDVEAKIMKINMIKNKDAKINAYTEYATENYNRVLEYQNLASRRIKETATLVQGSCLLKFGKEKMNDMNDIKRVMPLIPKRMWRKYSEETDKFHFGIEPEVTFKCNELDNKEITRRLSFRTVDFFQNTE